MAGAPLLTTPDQRRRNFGDVPALEARNREFVLAGLSTAIRLRKRPGAIWRAARDFIHVEQLLARIGRTDDDEAMMQQCAVEGSDRGLLTAVLRRCRNEDAA